MYYPTSSTPKWELQFSNQCSKRRYNLMYYLTSSTPKWVQLIYKGRTGMEVKSSRRIRFNASLSAALMNSKSCFVTLSTQVSL